MSTFLGRIALAILLLSAAWILGCCKLTSVESKAAAPLARRTQESAAQAQIQQVPCRPSFTQVSTEAIVARLDPTLEMGARVVLIGCESDLNKITSEERDRVTRYVVKLIAGEHYFLSRKSLDMEFRRSAVREVNSLLERPRVADILIYGVFSKEFQVQ